MATIYTDVDGDALNLRRRPSDEYYLVTTTNSGCVEIKPDDILQVLRAIAEVADREVLIVPKPAGYKRHGHRFGVVPAVDGSPTVQLDYGFSFAERLTVAEVVTLMWQLAEALTDAVTRPDPADVQALVRDMQDAGFPIVSNVSATKLLKAGYRKDSAAATSSRPSAHVFNALPQVTNV